MLDLVINLKTKNKDILKKEAIFTSNDLYEADLIGEENQKENQKENIYLDEDTGFYNGTLVLKINEHTLMIEQDVFQEYDEYSLLEYISLNTWSGSNNGEEFRIIHKNENICSILLEDEDNEEKEDNKNIENSIDLIEFKEKINKYKKIIEKIENNKELKNYLTNIISIVELFSENIDSEIIVSYF
jgi:hypothetical protein